MAANYPRHDAVDARILRDVRRRGFTFKGSKTGTPGIIDSQKDVGGWPDLQGGEAPADGDHDGMPDAWERRFSLNPNDPSDGPKDADGDAFTNVEEYLNGTNPKQFVDYTKPQNNVNTLRRSAGVSLANLSTGSPSWWPFFS